MNEKRWVKKVYELTEANSKWSRSCKMPMKKCGLKHTKITNDMIDWIINSANEGGSDWCIKQWKDINSRVREWGIYKFIYNDKHLVNFSKVNIWIENYFKPFPSESNICGSLVLL